MTAVHVTSHAAARWIERVDPRATLAEAFAAIQSHSRAIRIALDFGARCIRLGNGAKLILAGGIVTTVYLRAWILPPLSREAHR